MLAAKFGGTPPGPGDCAGGLRIGPEDEGLGVPGPAGWAPGLGAGPVRERWKDLILASMSGFRPPTGRAGFRAALRFPKGVEEVVMLAVDGAGLSLAACWAEGLEVVEGLKGISGLSRGEAMSESESGEASGLLVSESSSMAGYGGRGGVEEGEEGGGSGGRRGCRVCVARRVECSGMCLLGRESGDGVVEASPEQYGSLAGRWQ